MKINLGYVAISRTIDETSSSLMTYSYYKKLGKKRGDKRLNEIILSNFNSLKEILNYNIKNDIVFYRMTSNLIPLGTHNLVDFEVFNKYKKNFKEIGNIIKTNNLRVDMHLDQFCVLNSANSTTVSNTINILKFNQNILKSMNIKSILILHVGSKEGGKKLELKDL